MAFHKYVDGRALPMLHRCRLCGWIAPSKSALARHHLIPRELDPGGKHRRTIALCLPCHVGLHKLFDNYELAKMATLRLLWQNKKVKQMIADNRAKHTVEEQERNKSSQYAEAAQKGDVVASDLHEG